MRVKKKNREHKNNKTKGLNLKENNFNKRIK
jgi:hypothetical protein